MEAVVMKMISAWQGTLVRITRRCSQPQTPVPSWQRSDWRRAALGCNGQPMTRQVTVIPVAPPAYAYYCVILLRDSLFQQFLSCLSNFNSQCRKGNFLGLLRKKTRANLFACDSQQTSIYLASFLTAKGNPLSVLGH